MLIEKIEKLIQEAYGTIPEHLIPKAKAAEMPKEGPGNMIGIGANGSTAQKIHASQNESNQVPDGLDMTGDNEGTGQIFTHTDMIHALNKAMGE